MTAQPLIVGLTSVIDAACNSYCHADTCDSPIEEIMGGALVAMFLKAGAKAEWTTEPEKSDADVLIIPQFNIERYRADFLVNWVHGDKTIVVECDGHAYHRANFEQIERDHKRDMRIRKHGHEVMRFAGHEIHRDAYSCAWQVVKAINKRVPS